MRITHRMLWIKMAVVLLLAAAAALPAASRGEDPPGFSGQRALAHLEAICSLGPRPSGSAAMVKQRAQLAAHFRAAGGTVQGQAFQIRDRRSGAALHMEILSSNGIPTVATVCSLGRITTRGPFPTAIQLIPKEFSSAPTTAPAVWHC